MLWFFPVEALPLVSWFAPVELSDIPEWTVGLCLLLALLEPLRYDPHPTHTAGLLRARLGGALSRTEEGWASIFWGPGGLRLTFACGAAEPFSQSLTRQPLRGAVPVKAFLPHEPAPQGPWQEGSLAWILGGRGPALEEGELVLS